MRRKIAIIGSGISGLTAAHYLQDKYDVTVYEKNAYPGGHTATKEVNVDEGNFSIDTGFIVFNDWTYPNFIRLLTEIEIESIATEMEFSVTCEKTGLEYSGSSLRSLFAQKRNIMSLRHWKLLGEIIRFNRQSKTLLEKEAIGDDISLGAYVQHLNLSNYFTEKYLIPMGAAIWSSGTKQMYDFPALYFIRFFMNHGLLNIAERPQWRVIKGGSKSYVDALLGKSRFTLKLKKEVESVSKHDEHIKISSKEGIEVFDHVIFACHSTQACKLLSKEFFTQYKILSQLDYKNNQVILHTDLRLLPKSHLTWSSWNYRIREGKENLTTVTYHMNTLQQLKCKTQFCVTLNDRENIRDDKIIGEYQYAHPVYNRGTLRAQSQRSRINGKDNLWFCGAYWYAGFHEDGVRSALDVVRQLGVAVEIL